ncbi:helix-turn-helix transcriptional regulator [Cohnella silvisoli]|uniref:AraC family transcriptional regulator n=1 Tax=Cohnella silvisoli TaxID=2873699 RepID=A0ABV1KT22_9BACL|nr:AraC family transcriptional regulator [Cohnella silvisoli]MCD9021496.1 AraC family transcriptional regulator [Cohnella silvisoli]
MDCIKLQIPPLPQFITIGHGTWKPGGQHFERNFQVYDVLIVLKGTLYMTETDIPYAIEAGHLLILEPGLTHFGHRPCDEETDIYWLHFIHPNRAERISDKHIPWSSIIQQGTDNDNAPHEQWMYLPKWTPFDATPLIPIMNEMLNIQSKLCQENALQLQSLLAQLLAHMQQWLFQSSKPSQSLLHSKQIESYLMRQRNAPFKAKEMEQELHFQFDYLTRCLKKHTGMTPLQYVNHLKIEEAKRSLIHTDVPIPSIAEHIGIEDYSYFIRLFRKKTGMTPSAYRRHRQGVV